VRMMISRRTTGVKHMRALHGRAAVEAAHARAASCLSFFPGCAAPTVNCEPACGVPCSQAFGAYSLALGSFTYTMDVQVSGTPADCRIRVDCADCGQQKITP
jgi:hypothetical protein